MKTFERFKSQIKDSCTDRLFFFILIAFPYFSFSPDQVDGDLSEAFSSKEEYWKVHRSIHDLGSEDFL